MRRFMFQGKVENPRPQVIRETVRLLRKQLKPHGIDIETVFGKGYIMNIENKAKLKAFILNDDEAG
jgi:DNA-binding response OmpR family regulator